jgi:hypothetical protein
MTNPTWRHARWLVLAGCLAQPALAAESLPNNPLPTAAGYALDTMAPVGRWAARLELRSSGYDQRFDNDGHRRDLDAVFDGVVLDSSVFPALAALGGSATLGTTQMDTRVDTLFTELTLGYGVNRDLTAGLILPYLNNRTRTAFSVLGGNVGFNPAFNPALPIGASNYPFAPTSTGVAPLGTAGVKTLLTDPVFGFAYQPIETTIVSGLGDPTVGALWRFHKGEKDSAVLGFGVRFGLSEGDDPDNLLDVPTGDSSTDIRTRVEYFRELGAGFDLRLLLESKVQTPDEMVKRVPAAGELLATAASKEKLHRNLGDIWEGDIEIAKRWSDWRAALTWHRYQKGKDSYRSDRGTDVSALESNTYTVAKQWRFGVTWSGVKAWRAGKLPMPLIVKLETQQAYGGRNFPDVSDVYLQLTSFF